MATLYSTRAGLVNQEEFGRSIERGDLDRLVDGRSIHVAARALRAADLEQPQPFTSIGLGKPMSVRIHCIYSGQVPGWRKKDLMVTSGVRSALTFDSVGRAINIMRERVPDYTYVKFGAFRDGSPVVYYTKSVTDYSVLTSFEIVPDNFPAEAFDKVHNLFAQAGGLPIFVPAAAYLMAGSFVTGIIKSLGNAFLEKGPMLTADMKLNFGVAGLPLFREGFHIVVNNLDVGEIEEYSVEVSGSDVRLAKDGQPYDGYAPYIILGVDGKNEPALEAFEPQLASAAILEKFYPSGDRFGVSVDELGKALKLHNDLKFRLKAQDLRARLEKVKRDSAEYEQLAKLYKAYRNNIQQKEFELPALSS